MQRIAIAGENDNFVSAVFQSYGGVDDESFGTSNTKIGMEENYILGLGLFYRFGHADGIVLRVVVSLLLVEDTLKKTSAFLRGWLDTIPLAVCFSFIL